MKNAPRDGTEILVWHIEGKNYHPVAWVERATTEPLNLYWGMRWNTDYYQSDDDFSGWIPYPVKK